MFASEPLPVAVLVAPMWVTSGIPLSVSVDVVTAGGVAAMLMLSVPSAASRLSVVSAASRLLGRSSVIVSLPELALIVTFVLLLNVIVSPAPAKFTS
jgi:hypothetical protein